MDFNNISYIIEFISTKICSKLLKKSKVNSVYSLIRWYRVNYFKMSKQQGAVKNPLKVKRKLAAEFDESAKKAKSSQNLKKDAKDCRATTAGKCKIGKILHKNAKTNKITMGAKRLVGRQNASDLDLKVSRFNKSKSGNSLKFKANNIDLSQKFANQGVKLIPIIQTRSMKESQGSNFDSVMNQVKKKKD